jgi:hypothetical protein
LCKNTGTHPKILSWEERDFDYNPKDLFATTIRLIPAAVDLPKLTLNPSFAKRGTLIIP